MNNENKGAQVAPPETFTSSELQTLIAETRTRRNEMSEQNELARVDLTEKRAAIRFLKPKSLEEATQAQARFTVLTDAGTALDEEIESFEGALQTALAKEKRVRDLADLAQWRGELAEQKSVLETAALDLANAFKAGMEKQMEGMHNSHQLAVKIGFAQTNLGEYENVFGWSAGLIRQHLTDHDVPGNIVRLLLASLHDMQNALLLERNCAALYNDAPMNYGDNIPLGQPRADLSGILPATAQEAQAGLTAALNGVLK